MLRIFRDLLLGVFFVAAAGLCADWKELPVAGVRFDPDRQLLLEEHRGRLILVKLGSPLDRRRLGQTIRNLYETGRYAGIEVHAKTDEQGLWLTFVTEPNWFVGDVQVSGVPAPPTASQLIDTTKLDPGELHTQDKIARALQQIREMLEENGYRTARIDPEYVDHPETQQRDIVFRVTPGERAGFGRIVVAGDSGLTEDDVRTITKWVVGKPLTAKRVQEGLDRLRKQFQKQNYWQATARAGGFAFNPDTNQVNTVVAIKRGPRVTVAVEGASFSARQLRRYLPFYEEGVIDDDLLAEGARNLRDYLQTEGYFSARVDSQQETRRRNREEEVLVVYDVDRGPRHRLVRISIQGNQFFDLETIRERMLIREKNFQIRRGRFSQSLLEKDIAEIEELYLTNGFLEVEVEQRVEDGYLGQEGDLAVFLEIGEGPLTLVEDLRIRGAESIPAERFYPMLASATGQPFSEANVAVDRNLILAEYFDEGFQDASLTWNASPGDEPNRVNVELEIREGEPLLTRDTIVSGIERTRPALVERQIVLRRDEALSQAAMFDTQRRLYDLGVFSRVDVALQNPEGIEPSKNVLLQVQEARRWAFGIGGGLEFGRIGGSGRELTSPVGDPSVSPRVILEATRLNVRGKAHTVNVRSRFSNLQQRVLFAYEAPRWTGSDKWHMTVSGLFDTSRNVRTFRGTRAQGAFQLRHGLSKSSTAFYRYTFRRTSIDEETLAINPILIPLESQPVRVGLLSGTYIQDRRDDPTDSTRGMYNTLDLSFASGVWGSEPDFFRFLGQNSTYHRLSSRLVLARTFQLGMMLPWGSSPLIAQPTLDAISDPDLRIPISERFYAGGANSHRGFPVNQAGPRDLVTGFPVGGGAQMLNSVELRFPLIGENIGGVLFHDAGNVYSRPGRISFSSGQQSTIGEGGATVFDFDYLVHAVGLGVRYRTPIGPVRLDLAYSVNPPRFIGFEGTREDLIGGGGVRSLRRISHLQFHFSLGQTF